MKKLFSIIVVAALATSFASCGGSGDAEKVAAEAARVADSTRVADSLAAAAAAAATPAEVTVPTETATTTETVAPAGH
jgi:predicted small lipoprotein YifL